MKPSWADIMDEEDALAKVPVTVSKHGVKVRRAAGATTAPPPVKKTDSSKVKDERVVRDVL
jgi:hypothetical protein